MSGTSITAKEMLKNVREGSPLGQQYASDILRVARDFLARKARREASLGMGNGELGMGNGERNSQECKANLARKFLSFFRSKIYS